MTQVSGMPGVLTAKCRHRQREEWASAVRGMALQLGFWIQVEALLPTSQEPGQVTSPLRPPLSLLVQPGWWPMQPSVASLEGDEKNVLESTEKYLERQWLSSKHKFISRLKIRGNLPRAEGTAWETAGNRTAPSGPHVVL